MKSSGLLAVAICVGMVGVSTAQSNRGSQTAPPRSQAQSTSPRVIDFTNSTKPETSNPAFGGRGSRQLDLQDMPFGQRTAPGDRAEMWNDAGQQTANQMKEAGERFGSGARNMAADAKNSGNKMFAKVNKAGKNFFEKAKAPFKGLGQNQKKFELPDNIYRKRNLSDVQRLTDNRPRFQLQNPFQRNGNGGGQPEWVKKMNKRTKNLFAFGKKKNQEAGDWMQNANERMNNANRGLQNFAENVQPKWTNPNQSSVNPPLRQANNWLDRAKEQNNIRR